MERTSRLSAILELLGEAGKVSVDDVVDRLGVSSATARRDLDALASQRLLTRLRGGAAANSVAYDLPLRYKNQHNADAKARIARAAVGLIPRGSTVGLCGGTTSTAIADEILRRADILEPAPDPGLTVVTNAVNIAMNLASRPQIKTVMPGGVVQSRSYELVGAFSEAVLGSVTLDYAFIGVNGFDMKLGAMSHDEREASVNRLMASRAGVAVVVADSSKIDRWAFASIGGPDLFSTVITDDLVTPEQRERLSAAGYEVIVAE